jgi:hypothetical protein
LVFKIDTTLDNDRSQENSGLDDGNNPTYTKWAYYLPPDGSNLASQQHTNFLQYFVHPTQTVTFMGVRVSYQTGGSTDLIKIDKVTN